jgi:hypothetical protein
LLAKFEKYLFKYFKYLIADLVDFSLSNLSSHLDNNSFLEYLFFLLFPFGTFFKPYQIAVPGINCQYQAAFAQFSQKSFQ